MVYGSPCGRPEKVCLFHSSLISSKKNWFSSEKNCCYSFLSSSKKNLNDSTFQVRHTSSRKLHSMLHTHKDTHPHNKKAGVNKIPCECGKVYIGETGRNMDTRLKEHKTSFRLSEWEKLAIVKHAQHEHRIMWYDTQLITPINNWNTRRVREAIEIHRHDTVRYRKTQDFTSTSGYLYYSSHLQIIPLPPRPQQTQRNTPHPGDHLHVRTAPSNTLAPPVSRHSWWRTVNLSELSSHFSSF